MYQMDCTFIPPKKIVAKVLSYQFNTSIGAPASTTTTFTTTTTR